MPILGKKVAHQLAAGREIPREGGPIGRRGAGLSLALEVGMTNLIIYLIGTLLVVAGLAYAASRMGISSVWIMAGALVIIGLGLMGGIVKTRQKDPAM